MMPLAHQAYEQWLLDRGLENTSAGQPAEVFVRALIDTASTLIIATAEQVESELIGQMLKRLGQAIGGEVSVILASNEMSLPIRGILTLQPCLQRIIILGPGLNEQLIASGVQTPSHQVIVGPSAHTIMTDLDAKREFWSMLRTKLN